MSESEGTDADAADDDSAADPPASELDKALDSLKRGRRSADEQDVTSDGHARMSWSSVTEAEPEPTPPQPAASEPSFRFDLGSALARLGGEPPPPGDHGDAPADDVSPGEELRAHPVGVPVDEPSVEPGGALPMRGPASAPFAEPAGELPTRRPSVEPVAELPTRRPSVSPSAGSAPPLQKRGEPAPAAGLVAPADASDATIVPANSSFPLVSEPFARPPNAAPQRSVFEDAAPAPVLPTSPQRTPTVEPSRPIIPPGALPNLPTLPPATPAAMPVTAESVAVGPATPDIHAVRTFQLRAQRDKRRNRVVARTMLVVLLLAAGVAAALFFGRSYLYPTAWDATLTPIVDQIQQAHGEEFVDEVPLETLPNPDHAEIVLELTVGDDWAERFPEWRALGVASGAADSSAIVDAAVAWRPAIYDPVSDTLYRAADADQAAVDAALAAALEEVFARQHGTPPNDEFVDATVGVVGVSSLERINSRAIDRALLVGPGDTSIVNAASPVPLPLLYEFAATDSLGMPLIEAAGVAAEDWKYGDVYPPTTLAATGVSRVRATPGPVPPGTESLAEPVALGPDNWSLIWAGRLPPTTVDRLATIVTADAYRPVVQGDTRCFVADFQATFDATANELVGAMARWLAAGPPSASGSATLVSPTVVEVFACDPGAAAAIGTDPATVTALLDRQQARLR